MRVNTWVLLLHAGAFGLYLVSNVVVYSAWNLFIAKPNDKTWHIYGIASIFYVCASFLSQVLLCLILWDLGKPMEKVKEPVVVEEPTEPTEELAATDERSKSTVSLFVQTFDEEAEVQMRVWRTFMRGDRATEVTLMETQEEEILEEDNSGPKIINITQEVS